MGRTVELHAERLVTRRRRGEHHRLGRPGEHRPAVEQVGVGATHPAQLPAKKPEGEISVSGDRCEEHPGLKLEGADGKHDSSSEVVEGTVPPMSNANGNVESIGVHPLKSARGLFPSRWWFGETGPQLDRRWMCIDENRRFASLREIPALARLTVRLEPDDSANGKKGLPSRVHLEFDGDRHEFEPVDEAGAPPAIASLWKSDRQVIEESDSVSDWLSDRLGGAFRLVRHAPDRDPWFQPEPEADGATTGLADGYPVLLASAATLAEAVPGDCSMRRFRPNIVIEGVEAWAEESWTRIRIGDEVELELAKPCVRCIATTVDPDTGIRTGPAPLATLAAGRTWNGKPVFGWNCLVRREGWICSSDPITVLESRAPHSQAR